MECISLMRPYPRERRIFYVDLEEGRDSLRNVTRKLDDLHQDVVQRIKIAKMQGMQRTRQVQAWLERVDSTRKEVEEIIGRVERDMNYNRCFWGCCPKNYFSRTKLGMTLTKLTADVRELIYEGRMDAVAAKLPSASVEKRPVENIIGLETIFDKVWRCLQDSNVGIIGICGMGGVGKTTLLAQINNKFLETFTDVDPVMWVVVSRDVQAGRIQDTIGNRLGIADYGGKWESKSVDEKAEDIFEVLSKRKFVLLLDDLWTRIDLLKLGVPRPTNENHSKVVFTTRSRRVGSQMQAEMIFEMECLSQKHALDLFQKYIGDDTLNAHSDIPKLAKIVADWCGGLPLALIVLGRAMSSRRSPREWKYAIEMLKSSHNFTGMEDELLSILKFSYDSLDSDVARRCFLYCCIYPEHYNIRKRELIDFWIAEGLLEDHFDIYEARYEGYYIIGTLKLSCLLEGGESDDHVRMHPLISDVALWVSREKEKEAVLVEENARQVKLRGLARWNEAIRISLWGHSFDSLPETPVCPRLRTLVVRDTKLKKLPSGFFESMHFLNVLDLSYNNELSELPEGMGALVNLCHLDLSCTNVMELPWEVKNLSKLTNLRINCTKIIPTQVISSLLSLQAFSRMMTTEELDTSEPVDERALLERLECLEHLSDLCVTVSTLRSIQYLLNSPKLQGCTSCLALVGCSDLSCLEVSSSSLERMEHLESINVRACHSLEEFKIIFDGKKLQGAGPEFMHSHLILRGEVYFKALTHVQFSDCPVTELSWLIYAPSLQTLELSYCNSITEVIGGNSEHTEIEETQEQEVFSNLKELCLRYLPKLEIICKGVRPFPALTKIEVFDCPGLRKLPFDLHGALGRLKAICGQDSWWRRLEWEDEAARSHFSSKFVNIGL